MIDGQCNQVLNILIILVGDFEWGGVAVGIHVDLFFLRDNVIICCGVEGHVLVFPSFGFRCG